MWCCLLPFPLQFLKYSIYPALFILDSVNCFQLSLQRREVGSHCVAQAALKHEIYQPQCWDYRCIPPWLDMGSRSPGSNDSPASASPAAVCGSILFYRLRLPYIHSAQFCYKSASCLGHSRLQKLQRLHFWQSPGQPQTWWSHHTAGWQRCFSPLSRPQWKAHPNKHQSSGLSLRRKTDSRDSGSPSSECPGKVWFG